MECTSLKAELKKGHTCVSTTSGTSMFPMLRNRRDTVILEPVKGKLKKYDLPLYLRGKNEYVLHRILAVKPDGYVICGDNLYRKEYPVRYEQVLGVVTGFYRDERFISVDNWKYRLYVHLWCDFFPVRALILRFVQFLKRVKHWCRRKWFADKE